jgi:integrase
MNMNEKKKMKVVLKKDIIESIIPVHDHEFYVRFFNDLNMRSISARRQRKLFAQVRTCYTKDVIDKNTPITQWQDYDLHSSVANINGLGQYTRHWGVHESRTYNGTYSENTKADFRRLLVQLLNYMQIIDERLDSDDVTQRKAARRLYAAKKRVNTKQTRKQVNPNDLLKIDDFNLMMKVTVDLQYRALLAVLYFTGLRIGGLQRLQIKDVIRSDTLWQLYITDKTGTDTIPVYHCVPFLRKWLEEGHPNNKEQTALVFCTRKGKPLTAAHITRIFTATVRKIQKVRPDWDKPCNPHHFRHSRATRDCTKYNPETFKRIMKWSPNSKAMQNYLHFNTEDIAKQYASANKLEGYGEEHENEWICSKCTSINEVYREHCSNCNKPKQLTLKEEELIAKQEQMELRSQFMSELMMHPKLSALYHEWKNMGRSKNE